MDSPAEYVAQVVADLKRERVLRERAEHERDDYQRQLHDLAEVKQHMTSAAVSAAGTAEIAIGRLQKSKAIVDAAVEWRRLSPEADSRKSWPSSASRERLAALVDAHIREVEARS